MEVLTPVVNEVMVHPWTEAMAILIAIAVLIEDIPVIEAMATGICELLLKVPFSEHSAIFSV